MTLFTYIWENHGGELYGLLKKHTKFKSGEDSASTNPNLTVIGEWDQAHLVV